MNALQVSGTRNIPMCSKIDITLLDRGLGNGQKIFVRVGDFVELRTKEDKQTYAVALGSGPYQITGIGKWNCGGVIIDVSSKKGRQYPLNIEDVQYVDTLTRPLSYGEMELYFENRPEFSAFKNDIFAIHQTVFEFDTLLQQSTVDIPEYMLSEMKSARDFLARYIAIASENSISLTKQ